jgi:hypothetical protein
MATVTKDFRIKSGLVVEGTNATVNASDIITEDAITGGTQTNISVTYNPTTKLVSFVAENGVADSTTDNLTEGSTNKYFTDERAQDAVGNAVGTGLTYNDTTGAVSVTADTYDAFGSASTVAGNLTTHTSATEAHGATGAVVGTTNTQTLTNKTLTSPKINEDVALTATATELNVLDGITASTAELNILDGVTSTAAELNILDGATLTTTELNYVDGVTSAIQTQIDAKAPLESPALTGTPTAPTATAGTNTTQVATTAFVSTAVSNLIDSAPGALDTLNELAAAINDDASFASTVTTALGNKQDKVTNVSDTEIGYLDGVTSAIQTQLNAKATPADITTAVDAITTTVIEEGTNLYFTNARAVTALEAVVPDFTAVEVNNIARQVAATVSAPTAATAVTAFAFAKASYRSAKFLVKVAYSTHTEISEVLLTLDTSDNIAITEYAVVGTNGSSSSISADIDGTNVRLRVTPVNASSTVTVMGTLLV